MRLSGLYEISPLEQALKGNIDKKYIVKQSNKSNKVPPQPQSGMMGGNYGARLTPRLRKYFKIDLTQQR